VTQHWIVGRINFETLWSAGSSRGGVCRRKGTWAGSLQAGTKVVVGAWTCPKPGRVGSGCRYPLESLGVSQKEPQASPRVRPGHLRVAALGGERVSRLQAMADRSYSKCQECVSLPCYLPNTGYVPLDKTNLTTPPRRRDPITGKSAGMLT